MILISYSFEIEREYPKFVVEDSIEPAPNNDEIIEDAKSKQHVEYLPFWRQLPPKRGNRPRKIFNL